MAEHLQLHVPVTRRDELLQAQALEVEREVMEEVGDPPIVAIAVIRPCPGNGPRSAAIRSRCRKAECRTRRTFVSGLLCKLRLSLIGAQSGAATSYHRRAWRTTLCHAVASVAYRGRCLVNHQATPTPTRGVSSDGTASGRLRREFAPPSCEPAPYGTGKRRSSPTPLPIAEHGSGVGLKGLRDPFKHLALLYERVLDPPKSAVN